MKAEYKRDLSGNYLVLYEEEEPDTSSYQMRMLVGNTIPSVLKCRVQGVDGQFMVCFDITSKQSVLSLYEEKKIGYEDLQMILGGFVQVMEEMVFAESVQAVAKAGIYVCGCGEKTAVFLLFAGLRPGCAAGISGADRIYSSAA